MLIVRLLGPTLKSLSFGNGMYLGTGDLQLIGDARTVHKQVPLHGVLHPGAPASFVCTTD